MMDLSDLAIYMLADDSSSATVKAAIIGALALVLGAAIPALLARREHEPKVLRDLRAVEMRLRKEIESDRDEWRRSAEAAMRGTELRDNEINRLRSLLIDAGINPFVPLPPIEPGGEAS
jgi:hypothetical protein